MSTAAEAPPGERQPHLKDYVRIILARQWILISVFVIVVLSAMTYVFVKTPIYRSKALLLIEPAKVNLTEFKKVYDPTLSGITGEISRREFLETQYKLIVCRPNLEKAFEHFDFRDMRQFRKRKDPISDFSELFVVNPVPRSRLVWVTFEWEDPELAALVLDDVIKEYIDEYRIRTHGVTEGGLKELRDKADELQPKVKAKADKLQDFMVKHSEVSLEQDTNIIVELLKDINRNLSELDNQISEYRSIRDDIEQALEEKRPLEDMPEVAGSKNISDLKLEFIRAKQEYNDLADSYGPMHPEKKRAKSRMDTISEKLEAEIKSVLASTKAEYERAVKQEKDLRRKLAEQGKAVMELNKLRIQYTMLKDAHETMKGAYRAITKRIEEIEISMAAGSSQDNIFVIMKPDVPIEPVKPKKALSIAIACLVGLMLGMGLCFFIDYLDTTIKTKADVEELLGVSVIGFVPALRQGDVARAKDGGAKSVELLAVDKTRSSVAEAFRSIRTALTFSSVNGTPKSFVVTSSSPKEGKTLVSINLAISLAQAGKNVLLIDADMRKPRTHKVFRVASSPGLSNVLAGEGVSGIEDAIRRQTNVENLSLMPSGPIPPNPAEFLGNPRMKEVVDSLSEQFDVIVIDSPPIVNVTDASVLCQYVKGVVMVVRSFATQRDMLRQGGDIITQVHGRILGVILNNVDVPRGGYYSYDSYYYQQYYYYYGDEDGKKVRKRRRPRARERHST